MYGLFFSQAGRIGLEISLSPCLSALIGVRQSRLLPSLSSAARSSLASPSLELFVLIGVRLSCPLLSFP